ncbi:putative penicillin-binding 2 domain protein [Mycobacterium xenopi 3993]|nr:putative penicillin-binding 2 domain protein [Mycobacterium xenopi 3993]
MSPRDRQPARVVITPQAELLPTDDRFAPAVISEVKKAVVDQLDGQAGWRVVSVNQNGVDVAVLHEVEPSPAPSITISLDRAVQDAAQHAVDNQARKAMIVVIKPSTGRSSPSRRTPPPTPTARSPPPACTPRLDLQDGDRRRGAGARHGHAEHAVGLPG